MSEFDRRLSGFRLVEILHGDTLQVIAARELGDASRWVDIANINKLLPPYITDDPGEASDRVLLSGRVLLVPALAAQHGGRDTSEDALYGTDVALVDGDFEVGENGDLAVVSGRENLRQALKNRLETAQGELTYHPAYGALVRSLLGSVARQQAGLLGAQYASAALRPDYRVQQVASAEAIIQGDTVRISADVVPITGKSLKVEASL